LNSNGLIRKGPFGLLDKVFDFSRHARVRLGAPNFGDAAIDAVDPSTRTRLRLCQVRFWRSGWPALQGKLKGRIIGRQSSKVLAITRGFWITKVFATTLGETAGDAVTMTLSLGYLMGTAIFAAILVAAVTWQVAARRFQLFLYWAVVIAATMAGTTLADLFYRSWGIGYAGSMTALAAPLVASLCAWQVTLGSVSVQTTPSP